MIRVNVTIDRESKDVWTYITQPQTWQSWWGGGLSGVQPGWQTGANLGWESGDTSPIDSLIPNKLLRIRAGWTNITIMLMPGGAGSTTVEIEEGDPKGGGEGYDDGGAAQQAQYLQILQQLKVGVESAFAVQQVAAPVSAAPPPPQAPSVPPPPSQYLSAPPAAPAAPMPGAPPPSFPPAAPQAPVSQAPPAAMPEAAPAGDFLSNPPAPGFAPEAGLDAPPPLSAGAAGDDIDINVSNTGQRVAVIVVLLLIAAAIVGGLVYLQRKQAEVELHESVKAAFQTAHNKGYVEFWKKVQVDVKGMKSNAEFEARLRQVTASPTAYAKHIKENALRILDDAMPDYKAIAKDAPSIYGDKVKALAAAAESLRNGWDAFASEYIKFEAFGKANGKLESASSHWLGWQQDPGNEKWKYNAIKYVRVLRCIFGKDKEWKAGEYTMESEVTGTCAKAAEKPEWFRRVAFECLPLLNGGPGEIDADFEAATAAFKKENDTTSKLGIDTCIKKSREYFESEAIGKLAKPWAEYVKAQNALLDAIDANLEKLK